MTYEEVARHIGDTVTYSPRPDVATREGTITDMRQLAVVDFGDGVVLQCNPRCLELTGQSMYLL